MALLTTWSSTNRVVSQELSTSFTRENVYADDSDVFVYHTSWGAAYYKYTRLRSKQYAYIGMTRDTALRCAAAMNALYSRFVYRWEWDDQQLVWKMKSTTTNRDYDIVQGGSATPRHVGGDAWDVEVTVNESIEMPYRRLTGSTPEANTTMPYPFRTFEENPSLRIDDFRGRQATSTEQQYGLLYDFDYDERSVGWGSDEDVYHTDFHTPTTPTT